MVEGLTTPSARATEDSSADAATLRAIKEFLAIDRDSTRPVFLQLREGFCNWLDTMQAGQRFPSERVISAVTGLNRITIRKALQQLVREGVVVKKVGRGGGIVVARRREPESFPIHPLLVNTPAPLTLSLATFEYLPVQQQSWSAILRRYEAEHAGVKVTPVQVPYECDTNERYMEFIRSRSVDLFLVSEQNLPLAAERHLAAPLPEGLCRLARGPEFLQQARGPDRGVSDACGMPLHVGLFGLICNQELLRRAGCKFDPAKDLERLPECLAELRDRLPASTLLLGDASRLLLLRGIPRNPLAPEAVRRFCDARMRYLERLHPVLDRCLWASSAVEAFLKGRLVFYVDTMIFVLGHRARVPREWQVGLIPPEPGYASPSGLCCLCIRRDSPRQKEAARFLKFLLSPAVQDLLPTGHFTCAFRAASNDRLAVAFPGVALDTIHSYVRALEPETRANGPWVQFLRYQLPGIVGRFCGGVISRAQALDEAVQAAPAAARASDTREARPQHQTRHM